LRGEGVGIIARRDLSNKRREERGGRVKSKNEHGPPTKEKGKKRLTMRGVLEVQRKQSGKKKKTSNQPIELVVPSRERGKKLWGEKVPYSLNQRADGGEPSIRRLTAQYQQPKTGVGTRRGRGNPTRTSLHPIKADCSRRRERIETCFHLKKGENGAVRAKEKAFAYGKGEVNYSHRKPITIDGREEEGVYYAHPPTRNQTPKKRREERKPTPWKPLEMRLEKKRNYDPPSNERSS